MPRLRLVRGWGGYRPSAKGLRAHKSHLPVIPDRGADGILTEWRPMRSCHVVDKDVHKFCQVV
ncbi:hypothetical protein E2C01_097464 [Portunus trituberculatus]|uniref:Uncharacterized protein n=1 Tax=Portunus trituberculatus TaxID=210409 RepID=A0A5B7KBH1_PORTR|nr:hypothetical protein [Portunus trituberculatus]